MKWVSVASERSGLDAAIDEVSSKLDRALDGQKPDLILAFGAGYSAVAWKQQRLRLGALGGAVIGCGASGIIGEGKELEGRAGLSVLGAVLPQVEVHSFILGPRDLEPANLAAPRWHERLGLSPAHQPCFLLLPDPLTCDVERLLRALDAAFPGAPKIGGLASGARPPERNTLLCGEHVVEAGVVGVALVGDIALDTVVAQGCRPLGAPLRITRADRHLLFALDGQPVIEVMDALFRELDQPDRELFQRGPLVGIAIDPLRTDPKRGDFLIRNVIGFDRDRGVVGVATQLRQDQLMQFHARDAKTSGEDLRELLSRYRYQHGEAPDVALSFCCVGRGAGLYGSPGHDSRVIRQQLGAVPLGGFFCAGEIGPVHTKSFVHGFTNALGLFRSRGWN